MAPDEEARRVVGRFAGRCGARGGEEGRVPIGSGADRDGRSVDGLSGGNGKAKSCES